MELVEPVPIPAPDIKPQLITNQELVKEIYSMLTEEYITEKPIPHLTELIYCLTRSYDDRINSLPPTDEELMLWVVGFGLERVLLKRFDRPEAKTKDGISYHIDFLNLKAGGAEMKSTRASINTHEKEGLPESWLRQIGGYCYAEGWIEFDLLVLYLMGNYKPPFPKLVGMKLEFTAAELIDNWQYLMQRQHAYMWHITHGIRPEPYKWNMHWECQYCRYSVACEVITKGGRDG